MNSQNQSKPCKPVGGHKITYINVVKGRKMIPRTGQIQLLNAVENKFGRAIQIIIVPSRGKIPATSANKQGILYSSSKTVWFGMLK
jgi:hypothetical protein